MTAFLAILFLHCVSAYYLQLGNVVFNNPDEYLNDRTTTLNSGFVNNYYNAYFGSRNSGGPDGIYGSVYAGGQAYQGSYPSPSSQLGFFYNYAKWNANNPVNGDYSSTYGFLATTYLRLEEVDSTGTVVQTVNLNTLPWTVSSPTTRGNVSVVTLQGGVSTSSQITAFGGGGNNNNNNNNNNNQNQNQNQQQATTTLYGNLSVTLFVTISSEGGVLFTGAGLISSKSVGLDIEILNFPYVNTQNSLRFTEVYVTSTMDQVIQYSDPVWAGFTRVSVGTTNTALGYSSVYFDLAKKALINGVSQNVVISDFTATYANLNNYKLYAIQLTAMAKLYRKINYFGYTIQFSAGASNITYSQVYGAGYGPDATPPATITEVDESFSHPPLDSSSIGGLSKEAFGGVIAAAAIGFAVIILAVVFFVRSRTKSSEYPAAINETNKDTPVAEQNESTGLVISENQHTKYQALA